MPFNIIWYVLLLMHFSDTPLLPCALWLHLLKICEIVNNGIPSTLFCLAVSQSPKTVPTQPSPISQQDLKCSSHVPYFTSIGFKSLQKTIRTFMGQGKCNNC